MQISLSFLPLFVLSFSALSFFGVSIFMFCCLGGPCPFFYFFFSPFRWPIKSAEAADAEGVACRADIEEPATIYVGAADIGESRGSWYEGCPSPYTKIMEKRGEAAGHIYIEGRGARWVVGGWLGGGAKGTLTGSLAY